MAVRWDRGQFVYGAPPLRIPYSILGQAIGPPQDLVRRAKRERLITTND